MGLFSWAKRSPAPKEAIQRAGQATLVDVPASNVGPDPGKQGIAALSRGDVAFAVRAFRQALSENSESASNHVNLAYALQEIGEVAETLALLRRAVELDSASFDAHYMLGGALEKTGDLATAGKHLYAAVELQPDFELARADHCRVLAAAGDNAAARDAIIEAIARSPGNADFHHYLGNVHMAESDLDEAVRSYERALSLTPNYAQVHANLGLALHAQLKFELAAASLERALTLEPNVKTTHISLALTQKALGRLEEATATLTHAVSLDSEHAESYNQLGIVLLERGLLDRAIDAYRHAVRLQPDLPGGYANLGLALYQMGDAQGAVLNYRQGLAIKPIAELHDNLAIALLKQGKADEAIRHFEQALAMQPDNLNTRVNLAAALADDGADPKLGIAKLREILEIKPDHLVAHSNLLFNLSFAADTSPEDYLAEARRFDAKLRRGLLPALYAKETNHGRKLRIGFVSGDLYGHPVGFFLEGLIRNIDLERFELFAYPTAVREDDLSARMKPRFAAWKILKGLNDEAAARLIRADEIDVLIDLAGHTGDNRLAIFALRPAPVQVSWLGYFATTGVTEIDYLLADPVCVPPGTEHHLSERVWRLPETRLCYTAPADSVTPPVAGLPSLTRGHITFGCFQRFQKIGDDVLSLWGRVMAAVPDSRLLLQGHQSATPVFAERMLARMARFGIAEDRVSFKPPSHRAVYLHTHGEVDIILDTFPYNGGTTTCEALWMGVPTLTLKGDSMLSRQGAALMTAAGLPDWVADDERVFVSKAVGFASDLEGLQRLRETLRERVRISPLFDSKRFARFFEEAIYALREESHCP